MVLIKLQYQTCIGLSQFTLLIRHCAFHLCWCVRQQFFFGLNKNSVQFSYLFTCSPVHSIYKIMTIYIKFISILEWAGYIIQNRGVATLDDEIHGTSYIDINSLKSRQNSDQSAEDNFKSILLKYFILIQMWLEPIDPDENRPSWVDYG